MNVQRSTPQDNFSWMLAALILMLLLSAVIENFLDQHSSVLVDISIALTLLVAVWTLHTGSNRRGQRIAISILLLALLAGDLMIDRLSMELINLTLFIALLIYALRTTARQVLFPRRVDSNIIVGAMVLYLLLGLLWAIAYLLVEVISPGAMGGLEGDNWQSNLQTMTYYSFVTLSTLGYGDLVPRQPITQFLAYMEAIIGQFYLSILVASLVSTAFSETAQARPDPLAASKN